MKVLIHALIWTSIFGMFLFSCERKTAKKLDSSTTKNFDWLIGDWQRLNDEEGKQTYEHWEKISDQNYSGIGYTLMNGDTIFKEILEIVRRTELTQLKVSGVNDNPVYFDLTKQSINSATFENAAHDFPTLIYYEHENDMLSAKVSGQEMEINFQFEKIK